MIVLKMSYSIFGTKTKRHRYLPEGEPPPKQLATEGSHLIKELSKNQLNTHTSLSKQLQHEKTFAPDTEVYTDLTTYFKGQNTLEEFQSNAAQLEQDDHYRKLGLSEQDISILKAFKHLPKLEFYNKYSNINQEVLDEQLKQIWSLVHQTKSENNVGTSLTRHECDYFSSIKPQSSETKLLKFATQNQGKSDSCKETLNILPDLAKEFTSTLEEFSESQTKKRVLKKIRRKARALGEEITQLNSEQPDVIGPQQCPDTGLPNLNKNSLWDVTKEPSQTERNIGCKTQKFYTIKNGNIVQINNKVEQLTVEEIRKIPKFADYNAKTPSSKLFIKNLRRGVKEDFLKDILYKHFRENSFRIKLMNGKMKGQAFIEFQDEVEAAKALNILNGVLDQGRPIIVQFSDSKNESK